MRRREDPRRLEARHLGSYPLMGSECQPDFFDEENGCVAFGWNDIKWNDLFCDVANVIEALGELDEQEIPYEFCRIGDVLGEKHQLKSTAPDWRSGRKQFQARDIVDYDDVRNHLNSI